MAKTKYPKWFSIYSKPYCPHKPPETIDRYDVIKRTPLSASTYHDVGLLADANNADYFEIVINDHENYECEMVFYSKKRVKNPNYKIQMTYYKKEYEEYKTKLEEWVKYKAIHDEESKIKEKEYNRKLYNKLKKEFEKEEENANKSD